MAFPSGVKSLQMSPPLLSGACEQSVRPLTFTISAAVLLIFAGSSAAMGGELNDAWALRSGADKSGSVEKTAASMALNLPAITAIDFGKAGHRTRVSLKLTGPVDAAGFLLGEPARAILDLPEVRFQLPPDSANQAATRKRAGMAVSGFRFGLLEAGKSRIVMDLAGPARIAASRRETHNGVHQFIVEFEPVSREVFATTLQSPGGKSNALSTLPPVNRNQADPADTRPVVVLDPGHGGLDAGARGMVLEGSRETPYEKDLVLAFARTLGEKLESSGKYKVVFTRSGDVFISLPERVRIARDAGAKLFISIHADTLNERSVEGATVYTVSDKASDAHAAKLAEKENLADKMAGVEGAEEQDDVSDILFDLTRKETRAFSHYFARSLLAYWKDAGKLNKNPMRSAGFRVLMAPDVPSVLLELGYLSSKAEAAKLAQPEWRAKAAEAVVSSVDTFFSPGGKPASTGVEAHAKATGGLAPEGLPVPQVAGEAAP